MIKLIGIIFCLCFLCFLFWLCSPKQQMKRDRRRLEKTRYEKWKTMDNQIELDLEINHELEKEKRK